MRVSLSDEAQADADAAVEWYIGEAAFTAVMTSPMNSTEPSPF